MYESITLSDGLHDEPFFQSRQLVRMDLEIVHAKSNKPLVTIQDQVNPPPLTCVLHWFSAGRVHYRGVEENTGREETQVQGHQQVRIHRGSFRGEYFSKRNLKRSSMHSGVCSTRKSENDYWKF